MLVFLLGKENFPKVEKARTSDRAAKRGKTLTGELYRRRTSSTAFHSIWIMYSSRTFVVRRRSRPAFEQSPRIEIQCKAL